MVGFKKRSILSLLIIMLLASKAIFAFTIDKQWEIEIESVNWYQVSPDGSHIGILTSDEYMILDEIPRG